MPDDKIPELEDVPHVSPDRVDQPPPPPPQSSLECIHGIDVVEHPSYSTHADQQSPSPPQLSSTNVYHTIVDHP